MATDSNASLQVLVVEGQGLDGPPVGAILGPATVPEVVRVGSLDEARARLQERKFDLVVTDESRLRAVLDGVFEFVGVFSLDGVVTDVNRAPLVGGLTREHVVGRRFVDMPWFSHSPVERARVAEAIARAARGESSRFETNIQRVTGGIMYVDAAFAPLRDERGAVVQVLGSGVDVTARKTAERALASSEARLSEAQRVAHVGSWEWDVARNVVTWSDELYRVYGMRQGEFDGTYEAFLSRVHPEDAALTVSVVRQAMEHATPFVYDHRVVRPDGSVRMLHTRGEAVADAEGRTLRMVGCCWDMTDRWQSMRAAEKARAAAEASRREMEAILARVSDGFVALDRQWRYVYVNGCAGRMLGRDPESLIGKHIWTEFPEGVGQKFHLAYERALAEQKPIALREHYPPWDRWFENRIYPSSDGLTIFFSDVTDRVRADEDLRTSQTQLRALAARLDAVREEERRHIAREIHDRVGQELTVLKMDLQWMRGRLEEPEMARRAARMEELINQTLETTKRVSAELRPVLLDDLGLATALNSQAQELEGRTGLACTVDAAAMSAPAAERRASLTLYRILQEALTNIVRHAGARSVRIGLAAEGPDLALTVDDDGRGITDEELARPTALGLLGMRERALAVGGTVSIERRPEGGTRVTARVPLG